MLGWKDKTSSKIEKIMMITATAIKIDMTTISQLSLTLSFIKKS